MHRYLVLPLWWSMLRTLETSLFNCSIQWFWGFIVDKSGSWWNQLLWSIIPFLSKSVKHYQCNLIIWYHAILGSWQPPYKRISTMMHILKYIGKPGSHWCCQSFACIHMAHQIHKMQKPRSSPWTLICPFIISIYIITGGACHEKVIFAHIHSFILTSCLCHISKAIGST